LRKAKIIIGKNIFRDLYWEDKSPVLQAKNSKIFDFEMKYLADEKTINYPFDNFMQDVSANQGRLSIEIIIIQGESGKEKIHRLSLPPP
jgi:hypothetical protein